MQIQYLAAEELELAPAETLLAWSNLLSAKRCCIKGLETRLTGGFGSSNPKLYLIAEENNHPISRAVFQYSWRNHEHS